MENQTPNWGKIGAFQMLSTTLMGAGAYIIHSQGWSFDENPAVLTLCCTMWAPTISSFIVSKYLYNDNKTNFKDYFNLKKNLKQLRSHKYALLFSWTLPVLFTLGSIPLSVLFFSNRNNSNKDNNSNNSNNTVSFVTDRVAIMEDLLVQSGLDPTSDGYAEAMDAIVNLPIHPFWLGLLSSFCFPQLMNSWVCMGEEIGWRSFLYNELRYKKNIGFWKYSIITGILWGLWHAPVIYQGYNYPTNGKLGILYMTIMCSLLSPFMTAITDYGSQQSNMTTTIDENQDKNEKNDECNECNECNQSNPWFAAIFHAGLNGSAGLPTLVLQGGDAFMNGVTGVAGFAVYGIGLCGLYWFRKYHKPNNEK